MKSVILALCVAAAVAAPIANYELKTVIDDDGVERDICLEPLDVWEAFGVTIGKQRELGLRPWIIRPIPEIQPLDCLPVDEAIALEERRSLGGSVAAPKRSQFEFEEGPKEAPPAPVEVVRAAPPPPPPPRDITAGPVVPPTYKPTPPPGTNVYTPHPIWAKFHNDLVAKGDQASLLWAQLIRLEPDDSVKAKGGLAAASRLAVAAQN